MAILTAFEQLHLELINRARLDPAGEASRLGISLNEGLAPGTLSAASKQPLASNTFLHDAARGHSQFMINVDQFEHQGIGDGNPQSRIEAAGYTGWSTWGENIAWTGSGGAINEAQATVQLYQNLFIDAGVTGRGHRINILNDNFREVGVGERVGNFQGFNAVMVTENFGTKGTQVFVTGVAITDADKDNFYDIGEGRGGITVAVKTTGGTTVRSDVTESAGGYGAAVNTAGSYVVTFSGGGLSKAVNATISGVNKNVKVDLLGANEILSSATTTLGSGAVHLGLLGVSNLNGTGNSSSNTITGNKGANTLTGNGGNDTLKGGDGNDELYGGDGNDILDGGFGFDLIDGGPGIDTADYRFFTPAPGRTGRTEVNLAKQEVAFPDNTTIKETLKSIENAKTSGANDKLTGSSVANELWGGGGNDTIKGNGGNDKLFGEAGNDTLNGGADNDTLTGGAGKDSLTGGAGKDTFDFNAISETKKGSNRDQIKDFARGQDKIDVSGIDANTSKAGNQAFKFIGEKAFSKTAGELRFKDKLLQGDVNGDAKVDFEIHVNVTKLAASDFVL